MPGKITDGCEKAEALWMYGFGNSLSLEDWRHLCECDICYRNYGFFHGESRAALKLPPSFRDLIKQLKATNYNLNNKEFEMLCGGEHLIATTRDETLKFREKAISGYTTLILKLEDHLTQNKDPMFG